MHVGPFLAIYSITNVFLSESVVIASISELLKIDLLPLPNPYIVAEK